MTSVRFFVPGEPAPGGSKKIIPNRKTGRPIIVEDCKRTASWRRSVALAARRAWPGHPLDGPLSLHVIFLRQRPKTHFRTSGGKQTAEVKDWAARELPTTKPDTTKLLRSTEDALTGIVWRDDAQVIEQAAAKAFGPEPGALVIISTIEESKWIERMTRWLAGAMT